MKERGTAAHRKSTAYGTSPGSYPASLEELSPDFLPGATLKPPRQIQVKYLAQGTDRHVLRSDYIGPGLNSCEYFSREKTWECTGAL